MAGAGYKLFNTGDVLTAAQVNTYLMEQSVMVFANAAARTTALSGVVSEGMISYLKDTNAVEVYDGSNWVSSDDPNAIQNTIVDAKGDLISASAADVPARLAVGNNGETLVADSSASTGLRYKVPVTLSNPVVNGAFDVWQRGTSFSIPASAAYQYTADRWAVQTGANQAVTISRQNVSDTTNLPSVQYCARVQRNSGQTGTGDYYFDTPIETANSIPFVGRAVTLSFWARGGATFVSAGDQISAQLIYATGTDQNPTTWTSPAVIASNTTSLTTSMARYVVTGTVPTNATQLFVRFTHKPVGTAGATDYYDVTGVQISQNIDDNANGSTTPPFRRSGGTLAGELQAAQRYYWRVTSAGDVYSRYCLGQGQSSTVAKFIIPFPVTLRVRPVAFEYSTLAVYDQVTVTGGPTSVTCDAPTTVNAAQLTFTVSSGLTQYRMYELIANNSNSSYLGFSAEL